jgi:DNA-binding HxlR family transcriptional regulator
MSDKCDGKWICPIMTLMTFISKKWVLMILKSVHEGCISYTDIEKSLPEINPRILCSRLIELQDFWFIEKKIISKSPLKAVYCLTEKWESFSDNIDIMIDWTKKWM